VPCQYERQDDGRYTAGEKRHEFTMHDCVVRQEAEWPHASTTGRQRDTMIAGVSCFEVSAEHRLEVCLCDDYSVGAGGGAAARNGSERLEGLNGRVSLENRASVGDARRAQPRCFAVQVIVRGRIHARVCAGACKHAPPQHGLSQRPPLPACPRRMRAGQQ
jgi:hypothetical protein